MKGDFTAKLELKGASELIYGLGLGPRGYVQSKLTYEIRRHSDPYTPFRTGTLKNTAMETEDRIIYNTPYARYLWFGKLMVSSKTGSAWARDGERKRLASPPVDLKYDGAPLRGRLWTIRMWTDKGDVILRGIADDIKKRGFK